MYHYHYFLKVFSLLEGPPLSVPWNDIFYNYSNYKSCLYEKFNPFFTIPGSIETTTLVLDIFMQTEKS